MLSAQDAKNVVEEAVFQAGGFLGPFPDAATLTEAGLVSDGMRVTFQPQVQKRCKARNHTIGDISRVPNGSGTKIGEVAGFVQNATKIPVRET